MVPTSTAVTMQAAKYFDRVLHGARPDELPVEGPTTFQLVINSKTAKAHGVDVPYRLFAIANEVIE